jgi:hypothetical protein
MKIKFRFFSFILLAGLLVSCTTGQYLEMKPLEHVEVLGTVQAVFYVSGAFRYRNAINRQAYIALQAEAQKKYPDDIIDIRDIIWAIGSVDAANNNYEYSAAGKVIRLK